MGPLPALGLHWLFNTVRRSQWTNADQWLAWGFLPKAGGPLGPLLLCPSDRKNVDRRHVAAVPQPAE